MKRTALILVAALLFSAAVFAQEEEQEQEAAVFAQEEAAAVFAQEEAAAVSAHKGAAPEPAVPAREGKGFRVKIELSTNAFQFFHQDVRNDTYVEDAEMPRTDSVYWMRSPSYGDVEFDMSYTDPQDLYGGKIGFRFGSFFEKNLPIIEDVSAWVQISPYFRGQLGRYTKRIIEKVGGDKDLGVMLAAANKDKNQDFTIDTSDSLGLGSDVMGFLPTGIIPMGPAGSLELSGFIAPNEYWLAQKVTMSENVASGSGSNVAMIIPAYSTYKFGGGLKYSFPGWATLGAAYRTSHGKTISGTDMGKVFHDMGVYAIVTPVVKGLQIGLGYSGHLEYLDEQDFDTGDDISIKKPWINAFHFDVKYDKIAGLPLGVGLYNNISYHTLNKEDTINYIEIVDRNNPNVFGDESSLVSYNELSVYYDVLKNLNLNLMFRNYYATITNNQGALGQDYGKETFIIELLAKYRPNDRVEFRGGFKFEMNEFGTPVNSVVLQNSSKAYSIPVGVIVKW